jgi:hypothetical protein
MRRTLALLALLATSWPHVVALECALGSAAPAAAEEGRHGAHGAHGHADAHAGMKHGHTEDSRTPSDGTTAPGGGDCALVMACGLVMIRADGEAMATERASRPEIGRSPSVDAPSTTVPVADPPPPRRNA